MALGGTDSKFKEVRISETEENVVVLGTDGNKDAQRALEFYAENLRGFGDTLILVNAMSLSHSSNEKGLDARKRAAEEKSQELEKKLKRQLQIMNIPKSQFVAEFGKPGELMCDVARRKNASYIVTGTRGMGKLRRTIETSVSDYVLHHAHCPVIVCRK